MRSIYTLLLFICATYLLNSCSPKEIPRPTPKAAFQWSNAGQGTIQFVDQSTEADSYEWNFGDGSSPNTQQSPKHTFGKNARFRVTLTVRNPTATDQVTDEIEVGGIKPVVDFTWTNTNGQVSFVNKTTNADSYRWDFGNGKTSTDSNPSTRYLKAGNYTVTLTAKGQGGEIVQTASITISSVVLTLADVVDDQTLADYLPGSWGAYVPGQDRKFDNYTYSFSTSTNTLKYENYYNNYYTLLDPKSLQLDYKFSITGKVIYTEIGGSKPEKFARFERFSDDEMRVFRIAETSNSYSEWLPVIFTRISDVEKPASSVVNSPAVAKLLQGVWDQGGYSIYTDVAFDFSSGKNYYSYNSSFQGAKSVDKYEFKIDANNVMSYRRWNSSFDPAWKKYKIEIVSDSVIKLYAMYSDGKVNTQVQYTLQRK